ncbi:MAG: 50S ribosomal protein L18 [Chloroflexota bacterium]|nr:MAG: 50S ribosomal protein L18 [Chloroflexota bacterium]
MTSATKQKYMGRKQRQRRVRARVSGTAQRPRLNIFRSLTNIYAQVIDDSQGHTVVSASTLDKEVAAQATGKTKLEAARIVGKVVGERAKQAGIEKVVFDRGGFRYHGRVAAVAEGAREAGLDF